MKSADWISDVILDLKAFAERNQMPELVDSLAKAHRVWADGSGEKILEEKDALAEIKDVKG